jgi:hypothetical protein
MYEKSICLDLINSLNKTSQFYFDQYPHFARFTVIDTLIKHVKQLAEQ